MSCQRQHFFHQLYLVVLLLAVAMVAGQAQELLYLQNPSFEDTARHSKVPGGWLDGGFPGETPPDIGPTRFFRANTSASEGATHLVLITRDAGTWERVGNQLSQPLQAGQCYEWQIDLARSPVYLSRSRKSGLTINFNEPVVLRIWGGTQADEPLELLAVSPLISHEAWQRYTFTLRPAVNHPLLILEAMYRLGTSTPYAGNLLLDNASPLRPLTDCELDQTVLNTWRNSPVPQLLTNEIARETVPLDTQLIRTSLENMLAGRIDIGLYDLASLGCSLNTTKLLLLVEEYPQEYPLLRVKLLRKRLRLMGLKTCLKVVAERRKGGYSQRLTEGGNGQLQVWASE